LFPDECLRTGSRERLQALREEIARHDYLYHVKDSPEISDSDYDALFRELQAMEAAHPDWVTPDSPTQRVGGGPLTDLAHVTHRLPMLSLNNAFDDAEVHNFDRRVREGLDAETIEYSCEPKFDGLAVTLVYEDGRFVRRYAWRRLYGRGRQREPEDGSPSLAADDHACATAARSPRRSPHAMHAFAELNQRQQARGEKAFVNARNAAAGALRQLIRA
jgi:DNA ligase (NAD+)